MQSNGCLQCENRYIGCHSQCESYRAFKAKLAIAAEVQRKAKESYPVHRFSRYEHILTTHRR